ncbi:MAG: NAD(P)/FAD-dependent oxidoreductase [Aestuariivirga sp.]|uniref:phytoene desaturase family protein n=1 Tax=Aestuariivirga sp. TaxID=2650926 RepID=UPI0025C5C305|nr:NAD(P)/FAD-dependent oxidoreductase [Aestuariivirga sp.]MCA3561584.1 NAD(P)/FAD-dependent oxidoreductase [Aestuariivirga sp.]
MATSTFDAAIIGAGHNGLSAAIHLAKRGWHVGVFEAKAEAGGAVKTREVTLPGFRHDLAAMNLSMFAGSPFLREHGEGLGRHGLAFAPAAHCFASVFPDRTWFGVSKDARLTMARLNALDPGDAEAWDAMMQRFGKDAPHIFGLLGNVMPSWAMAKLIYKAWRENGTAWTLDMLRFLTMSTRSWADMHFRNDKVKATLAAWGLHLDFPPDVSGGALFPYLESMTNQAFGMAIGQGGAGMMIRALTGYLKELGGELHLDAPVAEVIQSAGSASGIRLANGRTITARRAVIANVTPHVLFGKLLPNGTGKPAVDAKFKAFRPGPGTMMVHLAMDGLPDWAAGAELKDFAYVHIAPGFAYMNRAYGEAMDGLLPEKPVLVVGQPTAVDKSRAPAGKHILWVQVRVLPKLVKGDAAGLIKGTQWAAIKEAYADRVVSIIEDFAPGTRAKILGSAVFSPDDLEDENPCLAGGDNLSGSHQLDQNFLFRPVAGYSRYKMPLERLYMCGAATWPGAGTGAGSGYLLAKMLGGG